MQIPGTASLIFLTYLMVFLPWAAFRSARRLSAASAGTAGSRLPSREAIWTGTLLSQGVLLMLTWLTARGFDYHLFMVPPLGIREVLAALAALAASFGLRSIVRAVRSEDERREMTVYLLAPRNAREWALCAATVLVASVAEEAAYRGVALSILWYSLGNPWVGVFLCAMAFALAHWTQGWKSAAVIFVMALVMHGLVAFTGTLVIAMVVHAVYDFSAGYIISRDALRYENEGAAPG